LVGCARANVIITVASNNYNDVHMCWWPTGAPVCPVALWGNSAHLGKYPVYRQAQQLWLCRSQAVLQLLRGWGEVR